VTRTNDDSWDLRGGVGATATMAAAARAVASRSPDPVINDPFAEVLVRAIGMKIFTQIVDGRIEFAEIGAEWFPRYFGARCRAFDDFLAEACRADIRQAVILASGLDCRAYRLDWPNAMSVYEIDQPEVIDWKKHLLASLRCTPATQHHCVGIDLRRDWPTALRQAGFDDAKPTAWVAEGLFIGYLPPDAQDEVLDAISALSARGSRFAADYFDLCASDAVGETLNNLHDIWHEHDPDLNLRNLTFSAQRRDPAVYLADRGWLTHNADLTDLIRATGQPVPSASEFPVDPTLARFLSGIRD
jgi:methyltransferase (TIGR00027 family)